MDIAHKKTDDIIGKIEKEISKEYKKAHKEIAKKADDYFARFATKDDIWQNWVKDGKKTAEEYKKWRTGQILVGKRWDEMRDTLAEDYANVAKISQSIANGYRPEVYALNHNYGTFQVEKGSKLDTSYTLYSRESVERLYRENPKLYKRPGADISRQIKEGKLKRWNRRRIQSVITQGILQGESIPNLAKRLEAVTKGAHAAAIRNARTMITGVENAGRIDAFERANDLGIPTRKQWMATLDDRTRHWHRELDGQIVDVDEPFTVALKDGTEDKIMYPGDVEADSSNIYNCRCTLVPAIEGFEMDLTDTSLRNDDNLSHQSYEEWEADHHSASKPITSQEETGDRIRDDYIRGYRG